MDDPYHLTPERLAAGVAECLPDMAHIARAQWSLQQLRSYGGEYFLDGLGENLKAYRRGLPNAYRFLCEAVALRIAILLREGLSRVEFCGRTFTEPEITSDSRFAKSLEDWEASVPVLVSESI